MEARKIIITGGATRIGAAIAEKLSGLNKEIVIHFNQSKSKAKILRNKLQKNGTKVYLVKGDLSKEKDILSIINFSRSKMKYFDCLINNASVFENDKLENFNSKSWEKHISINLKALDKKMKESASNLEFEEAAKIRDEIRKLQSTELEITLNPKIRQYDVKNKVYPKGRSTLGMPGTRVTKKREKKWKHGK